MYLIFSFFIFASPLFSQDFTFDKATGTAIPNFVAQLKEMRGQVFKLKGGRKMLVKPGTRFYKEDTLLTEKKSFAKIQVVDDSILNLSANTELKSSDFKYTSKTDREIVFSFIKGQIRGLVKNKAKEGKGVSIRTKVATMGIRGTEILANHRSLNQQEVSEFALLSGTASVTGLTSNLVHTLGRADRIILLKEGDTEEKNEKRQLTAEELQRLLALHLDEDKEFKPFLDFATLASPQGQEEKQALAEDPSTVETESTNSGSAKDWRYNLDKLNEQLRKNQNSR